MGEGGLESDGKRGRETERNEDSSNQPAHVRTLLRFSILMSSSLQRRRRSTICCSSACTLPWRERHSSSACSRSTLASASTASLDALDSTGRAAPAVAPGALYFPVLSDTTGRVVTHAVSALDFAVFSLAATDVDALGVAARAPALTTLLSAALGLGLSCAPAAQRSRSTSLIQP